jgi:hypothetical protein
MTDMLPQAYTAAVNTAGGQTDDPQWLGIYQAVIALATDPLGQGRVRLYVPQVLGNTMSNWAQPFQPGITPSVGTQVTVMFLGGNPNYPFYFLGLSSSVIQSTFPANGNVLNSNPSFTGGVLTPWTATNGTLSAVQPNADTNPPSSYAALWTGAAAGGGGFITEASLPFTVTGSQPYQISAWIFYPDGGDVEIGFTWSDATTSTFTATVAANTWAFLGNSDDYVFNAPSDATTAYPMVGPTASSNGTQFYAADVMATGQIPGQIIQPGTVTISQLAVDIIYAGIVDGTTITGGTLIADGTTGGAFVYGATPALGNLLCSITSQGYTTDAYGNELAPGGGVSTYSAATLGDYFYSSLQGGALSFGFWNGTEFLTGAGGSIGIAVNDAGTGSQMTIEAQGTDNFTYVTIVPALALQKYSKYYPDETPDAIEGSMFLFESDDGNLRIQSDSEYGDSNIYDNGTMTVVTTNPQTINNTAGGVAISSLQVPVSEQWYMVEGVLYCKQGTTAEGQNVWFNGPGASFVAVQFWWTLPTSGVSNGVGFCQEIGSGGGAPMASPAFAGNAYFWLYFKGPILFTGAGTFGLTSDNGAAGDTYAVQAGSWLQISPFVNQEP